MISIQPYRYLSNLPDIYPSFLLYIQSSWWLLNLPDIYQFSMISIQTSWYLSNLPDIYPTSSKMNVLNSFLSTTAMQSLQCTNNQHSLELRHQDCRVLLCRLQHSAVSGSVINREGLWASSHNIFFHDTSLAAKGALFTACNATPPAKSNMADGVWKGVYP